MGIAFLKSILILLALAQFARPQERNWWKISEDGGGCVYFTNINTGYKIGVGGVLKTVDAGESWSLVFNITSVPLYSIYFFDQDTGYISGGSGTILKTTNGGATWTSLSSGTATTLLSVRFVTALVGYAVGNSGTIIKTSDGGATWLIQSSGTTRNLWSVYFVNANTGFTVGGRATDLPAVGSGVILKTTNAGLSWKATDSGMGPLFSVYFVNPNVGYAVGGGYGSNSSLNPVNIQSVILRTTNGGDTWQSQSSGNLNYQPRSVQFINYDTGYIAGYTLTNHIYVNQPALILKTISGGANWQAEPIVATTSRSSINHLASIHVFNSASGYAIGVLSFYRLQPGPPQPGSTAITPLPSLLSNFTLRRDGRLWYNLAAPTSVQILVLDLNGRQRLRLLDASQGAGEHSLSLPNLPYGTILDIRTGGERRAVPLAVR